MSLCAAMKRERKSLSGGKQRLPSWGRKFAPCAGVPRCRTVIATIAALALLPIGASEAARSSHVKGASRHGKSAAHVTSAKHAAASRHVASSRHKRPAEHDALPKPRNVKLAALGPANLNLPALVPSCEPSKFRIVLDVGHTAESEGAASARNVPEFLFNLHLAQRIEEKLKADGFAETRLLVTQGKARPSLARRVTAANDWHADLFLSIHHDSVPDRLLENWEFEGKKSHFSDRFSGYSVFVSHDNPDFRTSLSFAELVAREMKAQGLQYAAQYTMPIMGHYQHPLLDKDTGVYSYDELVVLKKARMPAVLLEAGSIINRDEELKMDSPERRDVISNAVAAATKSFCGPQEPFLGPL
jgi:N-acetylmuramoyl-L-alanine amidase